jgi:hypothetical protein
MSQAPILSRDGGTPLRRPHCHAPPFHFRPVPALVVCARTRGRKRGGRLGILSRRVGRLTRWIYLGGYSSQAGQGLGVAALPEDVLAVAPPPAVRTIRRSWPWGPAGGPCTPPMSWSTGLVSAFAVGDGGKLWLLGSQASGGARPIHVSVHPSGRYLLCANWGSESIAVLPIDADGALGATAQVVENPKPYAHMVVATRRAAGCWPCTTASARSSPITSTLSRGGYGCGTRRICSPVRASAPGLLSRGSGRLCGQ